MKNSFKETQKFNQIPLWATLIAGGFLPIISAYKQIELNEYLGDEPMSDIDLIILSVIVYGLIILFLIMRLKTEINADGIKMQFYPFVAKNVSWNDISTVEIVNYGFVGGWGIRMWTKYGTVYNTRGKFGLAIQLKNGKKFLIGTQKSEELNEYLKSINKS